MKYAIEKNTIQETLVIPLYGRKLCTEQFPNLFQDQKAVELIEHIDYDFSPLEKLKNLEGVSIFWNIRTNTLWDMSQLL